MMMIVVTSVAVAIVCFILYTLDKRSRDKSIEWIEAIKVSLIGGLITAGVVFSTMGVELPVVELASQVPSQTIEQEIFVGIPNF